MPLPATAPVGQAIDGGLILTKFDSEAIPRYRVSAGARQIAPESAECSGGLVWSGLAH